MRESKVLSTNEYKILVIEAKDLVTTGSDIIFFRSDERNPAYIFQHGFQQQAQLQAIEKSKQTSDYLTDTSSLLMRQSRQTKEIDIANGVCATLKASRAPFFPVMNTKNEYNVNTRYIYAFYMPKYFNAGQYEACNGSFAAAGFDEVVCDNVDPQNIIVGIRCEVIMRSNDKMEYRIIGSSLQWNPNVSDQIIPDLQTKKQRSLDEFQKLFKYDYLRLSWGRTKDKPATVKGNPSTADFRKNIMAAFEHFIGFWQGEAKAYFQSVMLGFETIREQAIQEILTGTFIPSLRQQLLQNQNHESAKVIQQFITTLKISIAAYIRLNNAPDLNAQISPPSVAPLTK